MVAKLTGADRSTYDAILQHPVARNLKWTDVRSMLVMLADSVHEHSDVLKVTKNGKSLILHRPSRNAMGDIRELMNVRSFLEQSAESGPQQTAHETGVSRGIGRRPARGGRTEL